MSDDLSRQVERIVSSYTARKKFLKKVGPIADRMSAVKYRVAVMSTKGGVGKTTVTVNLALSLKKLGYDVGILDVDVHGPSVPKMLNAEDMNPELTDMVRTTPGVHKHVPHIGFKPVETKYGIKIMSVGLIWPRELPVLWRGPFKSRLVKDMLASVVWGKLDFLLFDMPPGCGDEVLTIIKDVPALDGVVLVTTPQEVSTAITRKAGEAVKMSGIRILGVVENMSWYICPYCGKKVDFGIRGGEILAEVLEAPLLGRIPFNVKVIEYSDKGVPIVLSEPDDIVSKEFMSIAESIVNMLKQGK